MAWQKWCSWKKWLLRLLLAVTAFFQLSHEKRATTTTAAAALREEEEMALPLELQTTPKCNQSHLLARLDAIHPLNLSTASALDDSSDSALGVTPHLPDSHRPHSDFQLELDVVPSAESTIYSSTPIIHGGLSLRRARLQTPNSPM